MPWPMLWLCVAPDKLEAWLRQPEPVEDGEKEK